MHQECNDCGSSDALCTNDDGWTHFVTMYAFSWVRWVYIIVFIGLILGFIIWKTSHKTKLPKYDIIFAMAGFILSVVWI